MHHPPYCLGYQPDISSNITNIIHFYVIHATHANTPTTLP